MTALEKMEFRRTEEILERGTEESGFTIIMYFSNLVSLIVGMLIYYGLLIILGIVVLVQLYDYHYDYDGFLRAYIYQNHHEFKTPEEV